MQKELIILMKDSLSETSDIEDEKYPIRTLNFKNFEKYKYDILDLEERCFTSILRDNEEGLRDALKLKSALCFSIYDKGKMIAVYYLTSLDELNKKFFDDYLFGYWDPTMYNDYGKKNTYYIHIVAVDPEYQGQGIGKKLNLFTLNYMKSIGIKNVLIHAHEGTMLNIVKKSGGKILDKLENLVNTHQDYYFCEITL